MIASLILAAGGTAAHAEEAYPRLSVVSVDGREVSVTWDVGDADVVLTVEPSDGDGDAFDVPIDEGATSTTVTVPEYGLYWFTLFVSYSDSEPRRLDTQVVVPALSVESVDGLDVTVAWIAGGEAVRLDVRTESGGEHEYVWSELFDPGASGAVVTSATVTVPAPGVYQFVLWAYPPDGLSRTIVQTVDVPEPEIPVAPTPPPTPTPTPTPTPEAPAAAPVLSLSGDTAIAGGLLTVSATGFSPDEPIEIWLHSTPVRLFVGVADAAGGVSEAVTIPAGTSSGDHGIEVRGATTGSVYADLSIAGEEGSQATLPATGTDPSIVAGGAISAVLLIASGLGVLLVGRRRVAPERRHR
ncbi:hypothetical protein [Microbacterium jejuense]|uniref:hypothetical protein n=1 Tax=Microbacterium jejuense TaxID=1263637 RepID=UPI0031E8A0F9